jgi:hypothetical protein
MHLPSEMQQVTGPSQATGELAVHLLHDLPSTSTRAQTPYLPAVPLPPPNYIHACTHTHYLKLKFTNQAYLSVHLTLLSVLYEGDAPYVCNDLLFTCSMDDDAFPNGE